MHHVQSAAEQGFIGRKSRVLFLIEGVLLLSPAFLFLLWGAFNLPLMLWLLIRQAVEHQFVALLWSGFPTYMAGVYVLWVVINQVLKIAKCRVDATLFFWLAMPIGAFAFYSLIYLTNLSTALLVSVPVAIVFSHCVVLLLIAKKAKGV